MGVAGLLSTKGSGIIAAVVMVVDFGSAMALCVVPVDIAFLIPADGSRHLKLEIGAHALPPFLIFWKNKTDNFFHLGNMHISKTVKGGR